MSLADTLSISSGEKATFLLSPAETARRQQCALLGHLWAAVALLLSVRGTVSEFLWLRWQTASSVGKCWAGVRCQRSEVKLSFTVHYCQLPCSQQPELGLSHACPKLLHNLSSHSVCVTSMTSDVCCLGFWGFL